MTLNPHPSSDLRLLKVITPSPIGRGRINYLFTFIKKLGEGFCILFLAATMTFAFPQRIISTMPSITETLFALRAGERVVGVTVNCNYPPEAKKKEKIGGMTINLEKIVHLKPDLIVMIEDAQQYDIWRLRKKGFPILSINPHSVNETLDSILDIGKNIGADSHARNLVSGIRYRMYKVGQRGANKPVPHVFVMVGYKPLVSAGRGTFIDDILAKAGGANIIEKRTPYPQINFEELYRLNPEIIIIPKGLLQERDIKSDQKLARLTAVQNGKILWIDPDMLFRPGPRVIDAIEEIAGFITK